MRAIASSYILLRYEAEHSEGRLQPVSVFDLNSIDKLKLDKAEKSKSLFDSVFKNLVISRNDAINKDAENHLKELVKMNILRYNL